MWALDLRSEWLNSDHDPFMKAQGRIGLGDWGSVVLPHWLELDVESERMDECSMNVLGVGCDTDHVGSVIISSAVDTSHWRCRRGWK